MYTLAIVLTVLAGLGVFGHMGDLFRFGVRSQVLFNRHDGGRDKMGVHERPRGSATAAMVELPLLLALPSTQALISPEGPYEMPSLARDAAIPVAQEALETRNYDRMVRRLTALLTMLAAVWFVYAAPAPRERTPAHPATRACPGVPAIRPTEPTMDTLDGARAVWEGCVKAAKDSAFSVGLGMLSGGVAMVACDHLAIAGLATTWKLLRVGGAGSAPGPQAPDT